MYPQLEEMKISSVSLGKSENIKVKIDELKARWSRSRMRERGSSKRSERYKRSHRARGRTTRGNRGSQ